MTAVEELVELGVSRKAALKLSKADREKAIHLVEKSPLSRDEAIWLRENRVAYVILFNEPPANQTPGL